MKHLCHIIRNRNPHKVTKLRRQGLPSKALLICHVLRTQGPMTRVDILRRVHALDLRRTKASFKPSSNVCYFANSNRFHVYDLTPKGRELALEYAREWLGE